MTHLFNDKQPDEILAELNPSPCASCGDNKLHLITVWDSRHGVPTWAVYCATDQVDIGVSFESPRKAVDAWNAYQKRVIDAARRLGVVRPEAIHPEKGDYEI